MNKSENKVYLPININVNYLLTCLFILIALIGILGNILVIISVQIDTHMRRSLTNRLIVHVACCDLIILLFNIPDIIQFVSSTNGNWILSEIACKLIRSILVLAQYSSVLTMCAVTIERFIGIVYPLRSKFLREKIYFTQITFFVWCFSLLCTSPNLIYLRVISISSSRCSCLLQYSRKNQSENQMKYIIHKSIESTIFYFIPLLLQLFCYIRIARQLSNVDHTLQNSFNLIKKHNSQRTQDDIDDEEDFIGNDENMGSKITIANSFVNSSNGRHDHNCRQGNRFFVKYLSVNNKFSLSTLKSRHETNDVYQSNVTYKALKSRRGVIKMLSVVVLIYFTSFSPQVLVFILFDTNAIRSVPQFIQTPYFMAFTMLLVTISSASNPIVYSIFCSKFRQNFARIFRRLFFCHRKNFI
ncbi:unnamed protein product [Rotaria socialis]|uniref:G-protein coupled receptors family 1 profile domain-containing protein n=1 Tax=Rotaria socialis TaxID=392032 RepID=A0A820XTK5_9BILA|nr:unnamed protein product [Rotaria socialis]CAF3354912.1 unnamed protein product [Rotaria socialis]CAF3367044.1 unnamed protein product [Rotaria socialis]CAF3684889.1 unnamed protein product [Rotaria socialis]CAF3746277.1 unnamed protein product [Rotaria socialis]